MYCIVSRQHSVSGLKSTPIRSWPWPHVLPRLLTLTYTPHNYTQLPAFHCFLYLLSILIIYTVKVGTNTNVVSLFQAWKCAPSSQQSSIIFPPEAGAPGRWSVQQERGVGGGGQCFKRSIRRFVIMVESGSSPSLMIIALRTQFHVERPWGQRLFSIVS